MGILITNIKGLIVAGDEAALKVCGKDMSSLNVIENAFLRIEGETISDFGRMKDLKIEDNQNDTSGLRIIDAKGRFVFPSFCDSHTHLVYAGSREGEFRDKIQGLSYEEIAKRGGGILNSAWKLQNTDEDELYRQSAARVDEIIRQGTGAVEIKSGYGLTLESELMMLRVIRRIKENFPVEVKSTFLGAHAVPHEFSGRRKEYVDLIINEMIPVVSAEQLADYIDVFCDQGFFTTEDTERILMAGIKYGLTAKIHANELAVTGGVEVAVRYNALSVDHLERMTDEDIASLAGSETMATILPGAGFFLGLPDAPARKMIDAGLPLAIASDFNPGSSPTGNMKLIMSMACINLKMLPAEAINASTINSAYAMGISETHGSIATGKTANVFISKPMPSYDFFPYAYGSDLIETVILKGEIYE